MTRRRGQLSENGNDEPLVRPLRQALVEIAVFSGVLCLLTAAVAWQDPTVQSLGWAGVPAWVKSAGTALAGQIGWYYGVLIPLLLSFYAFVGGGQLLGVPHVQRSRRNLGFAAELLTAATWPPFFVLLCFALLHADARALTFLIVPMQAAVLFLGAQLGGFIVFDRAERHRAALANADAARGSLARLRDRSRYAGWMTVAAHAVSVGGVSWLAAVAVYPTKPIVMMWPLLVALALLAGGIATLFVGGAWFSYAATDRVSRVLPWFVPYGMVLFLLVGAVAQPLSRTAGAVDTALTVQLAVTVLSTHLRSRRTWWRDWSIGGAARRIAAGEVARRYALAMREARATRPDPPAGRSGSIEGLSSWLRTRWAAFSRPDGQI
jgi:hypothetical protein